MKEEPELLQNPRKDHLPGERPQPTTKMPKAEGRTAEEGQERQQREERARTWMEEDMQQKHDHDDGKGRWMRARRRREAEDIVR